MDGAAERRHLHSPECRRSAAHTGRCSFSQRLRAGLTNVAAPRLGARQPATDNFPSRQPTTDHRQLFLASPLLLSGRMQDLLAIGLTGQSLTDVERKLLAEDAPYAVVIFGRNIGEAEELRELVRELLRLPNVPPED